MPIKLCEFRETALYYLKDNPDLFNNYICDELVKIKAESAINSGYEVIFVGEKFDANIILSRATTIESVTNEKNISE